MFRATVARGPLNQWVLQKVLGFCSLRFVGGVVVGMDQSSDEMALPGDDFQWRERCLRHFGVPKPVDVFALADRADSISGAVGVRSLRRLMQELPDQGPVRGAGDVSPDAVGVVWYELSGSHKEGRRDCLRLKVQALLTLTCQRCLHPMLQLVDDEVDFELYKSEAAAARAGSDDEFDPDLPEPLVVQGDLDLMSLVEDQVILAVPYVPKHESCAPSAKTPQKPESVARRESPFKVLEQLKGSKED